MRLSIFVILVSLMCVFVFAEGSQEYVVSGSLSKVAGVFYLHIKLISVETAEITGSSISMAKDESGFFEMCNTGVVELFH